MNDVLTIMCPVSPPEDRDDVLTARLNLLVSRGLMPRLFLPANLLDVRPTRTSKDRYHISYPVANASIATATLLCIAALLVSSIYTAGAVANVHP